MCDSGSGQLNSFERDKTFIDFYSTRCYLRQKRCSGTPFEISPEGSGPDGTKTSLLGENTNDDEAETGMSLADKYKSARQGPGWPYGADRIP